MNYIAIAGFLFAFALSVFGWNYGLTSANRIYFGLYKGVAEDSVITVDSSGRELSMPYISVSLYRKNLERYLEKNGKEKVDCVYVVTGYNQEGFRVSEKAYTINTKLTFRISFLQNYTRTAIFAIQEGQVN